MQKKDSSVDDLIEEINLNEDEELTFAEFVLLITKRLEAGSGQLLDRRLRCVDVLKLVFMVLDRDEDERLTIQGLRVALELFGEDFGENDSELQLMFNDVDTRGSGHIDFSEFATLIMKHVMQLQGQEQTAFRRFESHERKFLQLQDIFEKCQEGDIDTDRLSKEELGRAMKELEFNPSSEDVSFIFEELDFPSTFP